MFAFTSVLVWVYRTKLECYTHNFEHKVEGRIKEASLRILSLGRSAWPSYVRERVNLKQHKLEDTTRYFVARQ
jgi:hypothetical protein